MSGLLHRGLRGSLVAPRGHSFLGRCFFCRRGFLREGRLLLKSCSLLDSHRRCPDFRRSIGGPFAMTLMPLRIAATAAFVTAARCGSGTSLSAEKNAATTGSAAWEAGGARFFNHLTVLPRRIRSTCCASANLFRVCDDADEFSIFGACRTTLPPCSLAPGPRNCALIAKHLIHHRACQ